MVPQSTGHDGQPPLHSAGRSAECAVFGHGICDNDEVHHRVVFFEMPGLSADPEKHRHMRTQHIAFAYETLDDLLGTYLRLKGLGILPVLVLDEGLQIAFYYLDPDGNNVELNANVFGNEWTATEYMRTPSDRPRRVFVDPEKMVTARKEGASAWELHERAFAGEFAPEKPFDPRAAF